jgi:hypothetical protein
LRGHGVEGVVLFYCCLELGCLDCGLGGLGLFYWTGSLGLSCGLLELGVHGAMGGLGWIGGDG